MAFASSILATATVNRNTANPTIAITPVSGDTLLVVTVYIDDTTESDLSGVPTDGHSDTYVQAGVIASGNQKCYIFYVVGPTTGAKTITCPTSSTDTVINAATFTGTLNATIVGDVGDGNSTASATVQTTDGSGNSMTPELTDSLIIACFGQANNSTAGSSTFGTGQTIIGDGAQGGAEKFYGASSYEIITVGGANEQSITYSKADTNVVLAVEFRLLQVTNVTFNDTVESITANEPTVTPIVDVVFNDTVEIVTVNEPIVTPIVDVIYSDVTESITSNEPTVTPIVDVIFIDSTESIVVNDPVVTLVVPIIFNDITESIAINEQGTTQLQVKSLAVEALTANEPNINISYINRVTVDVVTVNEPPVVIIVPLVYNDTVDEIFTTEPLVNIIQAYNDVVDVVNTSEPPLNINYNFSTTEETITITEPLVTLISDVIFIDVIESININEPIFTLSQVKTTALDTVNIVESGHVKIQKKDVLIESVSVTEPSFINSQIKLDVVEDISIVEPVVNLGITYIEAVESLIIIEPTSTPSIVLKYIDVVDSINIFEPDITISAGGIRVNVPSEVLSINESSYVLFGNLPEVTKIELANDIINASLAGIEIGTAANSSITINASLIKFN